MAPALSDRDRDMSAKDGREMDFLDGELNAPELLQAAIKSFGEGPEADAMFPLSGALGGFLDEELQRAQQDELKERAIAVQAQLERRCDFLRRRLRLQQVRAQGRHAAEEAAAGFERVGRPRERGLTRQAVRALLERLRAAVSLSRRAPQPSPPIIGPLPPALASCAGALRAHLSLLRRHLDSDATESSSGAESDDEAIVYNNAHMRRMPLVKRAAWKWAQERASVASRWTWLQAQIQELEYKIRQHTDLQRRIRVSKGVPEPAAPSGYSEALPGQAVLPEEEESCARLRPLDRSVFKKRKLLQMHNLHTAAEKAAKPSNIRCVCQWPLGGCAVCTGRVLPMHPLPAASTLTKQERLALVDPGFHPVLSTSKEMSTSVQYSAKMKNNQWQQKSMRGNVKSLKGNPILHINKSPQASSKQLISQVSSKSHSKKKKHSKSKRGRPTSVEMTRAVQAKRRASALDSGREMSAVGSPQGELVPYPSGSSSPVPSPSDHRNRQRERTERSRLNSSYDIDNIVIPHSIAATTKPEILQYKEILTPKWRIVEPDEMPTPNNGIIRQPSLPSLDEKEETEDISDATVVLRHERCEQLEKGKYLQKRKNTRRQQSRSGAGSSHPLTPSETPPHTPAPMVDETSMHSESAHTSSMVLTSPASNVINTVPSTSVYQPTFPSLSSQIDNNTTLSTPNITTGNKRRLTLQMDDVEIISPYSPRTFPLCDETYNKMLTMMPDNHPLSSGEVDQRNQSVVSGTNGSDSESNSGAVCCIQDNFCAERTVAVMEEPASDSDNDYLVPPEEDPNDPEWNAFAHAE